jgi:nucleotide-sensitive chloride channel 1A
MHESETVDFALKDIAIAFSASQGAAARGCLYVTSRRILFVSPELCIDYDVPFIVLHAICNDPDSYPDPCVYCQLDEEEDSNADQLDESMEVFFIPQSSADLLPIFDAFSKAAMNNPDIMEDGEMQGQDELYFNEDEIRHGSAENGRILDHLESVFRVPEDDEHEEQQSSTAEDHS